MSDTEYKLQDSKLFELCRSISLLDDLVPDVRVQMIAESEILENHPRTLQDIESDVTRILINYTNIRGNSSLYQVIDPDRLDRPTYIDIDNFITNYSNFVFDGTEEITDPVMKMKIAITTMLTYTTMSSIGLESDGHTEISVKLSNWFLRSAISIIYNDPLDVLILLKEKQTNTGELITVIDKCWVVKQRL